MKMNHLRYRRSKFSQFESSFRFLMSYYSPLSMTLRKAKCPQLQLKTMNALKIGLTYPDAAVRMDVVISPPFTYETLKRTTLWSYST